MAEEQQGFSNAGNYFLTWVKDTETGKHTVTLTKTEINPDESATTNLAIDTNVKTMTYTE